jgi:DNA primase
MCNLPLETANNEYGFRYDPATRRLLIPLLGVRQAGFLGRATHGERPKWRLYGTGDRYALLSGRQGTMVVVEDCMSAIAINRAGWPAIALLGTRVSDVQAMSLAVPNLIGWFDDDPAGNAAWAHLRKRMSIWPTNLTRVITPKDPKHIHRAEIVARLEGTYD